MQMVISFAYLLRKWYRNFTNKALVLRRLEQGPSWCVKKRWRSNHNLSAPELSKFLLNSLSSHHKFSCTFCLRLYNSTRLRTLLVKIETHLVQKALFHSTSISSDPFQISLRYGLHLLFLQPSACQRHYTSTGISHTFWVRRSIWRTAWVIDLNGQLDS